MAEVATASDELTALLQRHLERARAAWPELELDAQGFVDFLRQRAGAGGHAAETLRADELYLVFGCLAGDRRALGIFKEQLLEPAVQRARTVLPVQADREELLQAVAERLLVASEGRPRVAEYVGHGSLAGWVNVTVLRTALNRQRGRPTRPDEPHELAEDPETSLFHAGAQRSFSRALKEALARLPVGERVLLRMYFFDGATVAELGRLRGSSQASMSRTLAAIRARVFEQTMANLQTELRLSESDLQSFTKAAVSGLDTSLRSVLAEQ
jgi:RNA polymerase sigma-70 factor